MRLLRWFRSTPLDPLRIPARAKVPVDDSLMQRIADARARLDERGIDIKSLRQERPAVLRGENR